ncbi:MAG: hypothetical protein A2017_06490 [Lentisphaerae bacterium GWF2_44_16]|nr:MAG: hypothetical protein A2017_06490 [Lentisphaerae bacterium GWF2_44_16]
MTTIILIQWEKAENILTIQGSILFFLLLTIFICILVITFSTSPKNKRINTGLSLHLNEIADNIKELSLQIQKSTSNPNKDKQQ